ncbi:MAG: F0F1 ATP synthase subunit epsilon [Bacteroidales bacterium]|nr:F0F1 ATP synthase subunit epsilon [Candidatus Colimorpha onthohippi]
MKVTITKPDGSVYDGEARLIQLPGCDGQFEMLENHAPIIAALTKGTIRLIGSDDSQQLFEIRGGVLKSERNSVTILAQ